MASAAQSHGFYEGTNACEQAWKVASDYGDARKLETAQKLTELLPDHVIAWKLLALAARYASNAQLARDALERVAAMESTAA